VRRFDRAKSSPAREHDVEPEQHAQGFVQKELSSSVMEIQGFMFASILAVAVTAACSSESSKPSRPVTIPAPVDPATVGTVTGHITSPQPGAIVTLIPQAPPATPPPAVPATLDQVQMTFVPDTVIAEVGEPVSFRSSDTELHNINVVSSDTRRQEFNRSIIPGTTFEYTFETPGFYDVHCDIHSAMNATIFVAKTPFATIVSQDGAFTIGNVPPGQFTLTVYNGSETRERQIQVVVGLNEVPATGD
jgi:plastocyanin